MWEIENTCGGSWQRRSKNEGSICVAQFKQVWSDGGYKAVQVLMLEIGV